ncbi:MAG TPA: SCO1664 family protein [Actinomycetota bacterium]|nr:SCO1664 family protein [Actinomycetota bacterium]
MSQSLPAPPSALDLLAEGELEIVGQVPFSSNYVFVARACRDGDEALAIYKPRRGERPLWDFPQGSLAAREVAAYLVGVAAGWGLVPPTVLRRQAPLGSGSLQLFIEHDPERHYFTLAEGRLEDFAVFAAFDVVINNADRKAGHVLEDAGGRLWAVDHGVTFHPHEKLRTVIWHLAGAPLDAATIEGLERLRLALSPRGRLAADLGKLLSAREIGATRRRVDRLLNEGRLPEPTGDHHLPWPLV